ncbi:MAG TPA: hypothetical protein VNI60_09985 [Pyrinomonadaceae bacterium]|nr:hypothetical protein [Pyrinomonadaceae bacterium]
MTITAIIFVIFLLAVAAITFFVMKKAVKIAIRAVIVALILLIAIVGGISLWMFGTDGNNSDSRPAANKKAR